MRNAFVRYDHIGHGRKRVFENIESLIFNLNSNNSSAYFQPPSAPHRGVSTAEVTAERIPSLSISLFLAPSFPLRFVRSLFLCLFLQQ